MVFASADRHRAGSLGAVSISNADHGAMVESPPEASAKRVLTGLGLVVLAASAAFGGDLLGVRERLLGPTMPQPRPAAVSRAADGVASTPATTAPADETVLRSQPWWQDVAELQGDGPMTTAPFAIDGGAIQWRATGTCRSGRLVVRADRGSEPLVEADCPGTGAGYSTETGPTRLQVEASGSWELQVQQQLDVPLVEPPLPAMTAPGALTELTGSFYRMDQSATGAVTIYRLADGEHALRLDDFFVTPNIDLEIHLSPLEAPRTSEEFMSAPSAWIAPLDVTAGSMNFTVPPEVDPGEYRSVVIWCPLIDSAYAAATLTPGP